MLDKIRLFSSNSVTLNRREIGTDCENLLSVAYDLRDLQHRLSDLVTNYVLNRAISDDTMQKLTDYASQLYTVEKDLHEVVLKLREKIEA